MASSRAAPHKEFQEDPRYRQCTREMVLTAIYTVALLIVMYGTAAALGDRRSNEIDLILIWPEWFFWAGVVGPVIFMILPAFIVRYGFQSMSLAPDDAPAQEDKT